MSDSESSGSTIGGISLFISICGMIYAGINHKRIRGKCCGREVSASIDIEPTTNDSDKKEKDDNDKENNDAEPVVEDETKAKSRRTSISSVKSDDSIRTIPKNPVRKYYLSDVY
jgi:hypothetical protein